MPIYQDLAEVSGKIFDMNTSGKTYLAIGWDISSSINSYTISPSDLKDILKKLVLLRRNNQSGNQELGSHDCEFCKENNMVYYDTSTFHLDKDDIRYIMPGMIIHNIGAHGYTPPKSFFSIIKNLNIINVEKENLIDPFYNNEFKRLGFIITYFDPVWKAFIISGNNSYSEKELSSCYPGIRLRIDYNGDLTNVENLDYWYQTTRKLANHYKALSKEKMMKL